MTEPHLGLMRRYAAKFLGDRGEDAVQTALLNAWKVHQKGVTINHPRAWLMRLTRNACINISKLAAHQFHYQFVDERESDESGEGLRPHERTVPDERSNPYDVLVTRDDTRAVLQAVAALPESQRLALLDNIARDHGAKSTSGGERMLVHRARTEVRRKVQFPYAA